MIKKTITGWLTAAVVLATAFGAESQVEPAGGVAVTYQLPTNGPLPKTYRVTLAITDPKEPDWIVSTFVGGAVRTVTAENQGRFTELWDGLDENFMPVPPGTYGVKGIYMPARKWHIDGQYHTLIPRYAVGAGDSWLPSREHDDKLPRIWACVFGTFADVAVGPNGKAAFYHRCLENGTNNYLVDLNKPIGYDQVLAGFGSGGAAGGWATATDGETIWSVSDNSGIQFIYRADQKPFGTGHAYYRGNVYLPKGHVTGVAALREPATGRALLYAAMRGKMVVPTAPPGQQTGQLPMVEDRKQLVNRIVVLDGTNAAELGAVAVLEPQAVMVRPDVLTVLHALGGGGFAVSTVSLKAGLPEGELQQVFAVPAEIAKPFDCERDAQDNFYISDTAANQVYRLNTRGEIVHRFGRAPQQQAGHYDEQVFMCPGKLATWTDADGEPRLIVVEWAGPGRISEWSPTGKLLRQWFIGRSTNCGYVADPEDPERIYVASGDGKRSLDVPGDLQATAEHGLIRYKVDYETGGWKVDAVWPDICGGGSDNFPGGGYNLRIHVLNGRKYLVSARVFCDDFGIIIYRQDGDRWVPSAGLVLGRPNPWKNSYWWHDANGDGKLQEEEYKDHPANPPSNSMSYWGDTWLPDLSFALIDFGSPNVWRLAPAGFDEHGNPIYDGSKWKKLITDPIYSARAQGSPPAIRGGNEMGESFASDWDHVFGSMQDGFYINTRNGPAFDANTGSQLKICRYVPDGNGGYRLKWRIGRTGFGVAEPGEMYGPFLVTPPTGGLVGVFDSCWGAYHVFTDEGLFVDTLFVDAKRFQLPKGGMYSMRSEFFGGYHFLNRRNGKVYVAMGRNAVSLFEVEGWTETENSVHPIKSLPASVTITAGQIAPPPEIALQVRGGAGKARVARFYPSTGGGPALDGSMRGWEECEPIVFGTKSAATVQVRCMYDPDHLYLRWQLDLAETFGPRPLQPADRIFTHDRTADTASFYLQGDPNARPGGTEGRPGDLRIVFGMFEDGGKIRPVALGMYPKWYGPGQATPLTYGSPVGKAAFEHVGLMQDVRLGSRITDDQKGLVIAAAIPRSVLPALPKLSSAFRTQINFDVTLGGHNKFWWSNPGGVAGTLTYDEPAEARLYPASWAQAQFIGMGELPIRSWSVNGPWYTDVAYQGSHENKTEIQKRLDAATYPPDSRQVQIDAVDRNNRGQAVGWNNVQVNTADYTLHLTPSSGFRDGCGLYFAAAWVYASADCEMKAEFPSYNQNNASAWVNGERLGEVAREAGVYHTVVRDQVLKLRKGWNQIFLRGYALGYDLRFGVILHGPPDQLWSLRLSTRPPSTSPSAPEKNGDR